MRFGIDRKKARREGVLSFPVLHWHNEDVHALSRKAVTHRATAALQWKGRERSGPCLPVQEPLSDEV